MEILQNIYQIKLPFIVPKTEQQPVASTLFKSKNESPASSMETMLISRPVPAANVYMIVGTEENMLVDTGGNTEDAFAVLAGELKNYGFSVRDINKIVITHSHPDHSGLATKIAALSGATIYMNEAEAVDLKYRYDEYDHMLEENLKVLKSSGAPPDEAVMLNHMLPREFMKPVETAIFLREGDKIKLDPFEFSIVETPGHSTGHVCLYEPKKRFFFCGDTVLTEITPNIGYSPLFGRDMLGEFLKSLEKIYQMDINFAFPGHGPAFSGVKGVIESLARHHEERERLIMNTIEGSSKTPYQVAKEITWNVNVKDGKYDYMSILDKRLAITETVAHLEHMANEGEIGKMEENGVNVYSA